MAPVCVLDVGVERLLLAWRRGKRERRRWAAQQGEHRSAGNSGDRAAGPNAKDQFIILLIIPAAPLMMLSASRDHLTPHAPELFPDRIQPRQPALCRHHAAAQPPVV
jgi:hypothetical protein